MTIAIVDNIYSCKITPDLISLNTIAFVYVRWN
jgi:hypothetical protein